MAELLTIAEFLFQVREQLGEIRMRAQQEQNGVADVHPSQVRVQRSQGTRNFLSEYWAVAGARCCSSCFCSARDEKGRNSPC